MTSTCICDGCDHLDLDGHFPLAWCNAKGCILMAPPKTCADREGSEDASE